ncbi:outer membrane protein [Pseudomonas sp. SORGH_AS199]|uniref:TolC family outer membrane protein n=1 Tax=Pseudomonas sp. SORGH_AS_0199 TaxID=3041761 RepID=UPI002859A9E4|nr:TolC family outer membrane protein [Pseudomonas sp. SORGH_AS_0199]MDR6231819.1 outer membrane protein [Pseudomonas sp. SORGH_AS_0199]
MRRFLLLAALCSTAGLAQAQVAGNGLLDVYREALDNNADLAAERAGLGAQREAVPQARAGLLPQIGLGAQFNDTHTSLQLKDNPALGVQGGRYSSDRSSQLIQATLSQPLFRADRWFQLKAAKAATEQAELQFSAAQQQLILQTAEGYFSALRAQDALATARAEEKALYRQLDQSRERYKVGLTDDTDVLQAQASFDNAQANRSQSEQQVADAFQALTRLTDRDYGSIAGIRHDLPILPPQPNDARQWVDTAMRQNLQLLAAGQGVNAAQETLRQRRAGHLPTVDAVARYSHSDNDAVNLPNAEQLSLFGSPVNSRSIGIQVEVPLYSGGTTSSQARQAYQQLDRSEQQQESLRRQVVQNTRNAHRAINTDIEQVRARRLSIASSQRALRATEIAYQVGSRTIVDVLDAQRLLYNAVRQYNDARYNYILDTLRLKQAAGTLAPNDLLALSGYLDPHYDPDRDFLPPDLAKTRADVLPARSAQGLSSPSSPESRRSSAP